MSWVLAFLGFAALIVLHELGHFAGNKRHRPRCTSSPLVGALGRGEWWRTPRDFFFGGCSSATAAAASRTAPRGFVHRREIRTEVVRVDAPQG